MFVRAVRLSQYEPRTRTEQSMGPLGWQDVYSEREERNYLTVKETNVHCVTKDLCTPKRIGYSK